MHHVILGAGPAGVIAAAYSIPASLFRIVDTSRDLGHVIDDLLAMARSDMETACLEGSFHLTVSSSIRVCSEVSKAAELPEGAWSATRKPEKPLLSSYSYSDSSSFSTVTGSADKLARLGSAPPSSPASSSETLSSTSDTAPANCNPESMELSTVLAGTTALLLLPLSSLLQPFMVDDMAEEREQMWETETTGLATGLPEQGGSLGVQLTLERRNGS